MSTNVALPPSPAAAAASTKITKRQSRKKGPGAGADEHYYSSNDLKHIHDVHIDSTLIPHSGMLSGDISGPAYEAYEQSKIEQMGSWGDHLRAKKSATDFNLNSLQLKKLMQIMDRVRVRKKQDSAVLNLSKAADRKAHRMQLLQELVVAEDENFRRRRVYDSRCSAAMRFAIYGDELSLRQELEFLPRKALDQREITRGGRTLLHEAVGNGHLPIVRVLLSDFKANPNISTLMGWSSPLHIAAEKNHRQIAAYLIAFGANLRALDAYGRTPLHLVNSEQMLKLFMKFADRVDPNIKSVAGLLPSQHYALTFGDNRNTTLELMIQRFEDRARSEAAVLLRLEQKAAFEKSMGEGTDFPLAISQNSSIVDSKDPLNRTKNVYNYAKKKS